MLLFTTLPTAIQTTSLPVPLQTTPIAVAGTIGLLAVFLTLTAHIAARNVLGDVPVRKALLVGPGPALISVVTPAYGVPAFVSVPLAILVDGALIKHAYDRDPRLTAYVTFIHIVVTIILGAVLFSLLALLASRPGA